MLRTQTDDGMEIYYDVCSFPYVPRERASGEPKKSCLGSAGCCFSFASHLSIAENAPAALLPSSRRAFGSARAGCVCLARSLHTTTQAGAGWTERGRGWKKKRRSGGHEEEGKNYIREEGEGGRASGAGRKRGELGWR